VIQWYSTFVEKEIPNSQEKSAKGGRLRDAARQLRTLPLDRMPTPIEWEAVTEELTKDELDRLSDMAQGHLDRALEADKADDALEEAGSAVLLRPQDTVWALKVVTALRTKAWTGDEAHAFFAAVERRTGRKSTGDKGWPRWLIPTLAALILVPLAAWALIALWPGLNLGSPLKLPNGPRSLEAAVDTQGVRANTKVVGSKLMVYPEATVAEFSAWVTFPDHRVDVWEGSVSVLDSAGGVLTSRDLEFHSSSQGPVDPGQGVEIFQQFDAWPWFDKAASFQVTTTRILAKEARPRDRKELPVAGLEALSSGYNLKVWVQADQWSQRFAARVHNLDLELENTGLKPFTDLRLALRWVDAQGKVLKTQSIRPVSAFRTALPSGSRLPWSQETVFDTEVFPWESGQEPHPVLELTSWQ
jgi:hypothetical protein